MFMLYKDFEDLFFTLNQHCELRPESTIKRFTQFNFPLLLLRSVYASTGWEHEEFYEHGERRLRHEYEISCLMVVELDEAY